MFLLKKISLICILSHAYGFALPFEGLYKLDIIHYNDFHARFQETSVDTPTCRYNNNSCIGGFPRLYQEIQVLLQEKPHALVLNAGDSFQGTYWYTLLKWNVTQEFMNLIPHDAHAIGNHEFDDGPAGLAPYLSALKAPVLAANMDTSEEPALQGLYRPSVVVKRGGRRIGIIGLITQDTKSLSSPGKVVFTDPKEATRREARALCDQGVDIIVLLSHCGLDIDKEIARELGEHIDIIVGGHTHSLLWNGPAPSGEGVAGPYPVIIQPTEDQNHQVLIVQASAFTKYMGNLSVYFDFRGDYVKWEGGALYLDRSIPENEEIKARLSPYAALVQDAESAPVGESKHTMRLDDCVYGECTVGDMLVDAYAEYAKSYLKTDEPVLSFIQRGNIKSSIIEGVITKGSIFELLPYYDRVEVFRLSGTYVRQALEHSVSDAWDTDLFKGPYVLQLSGMNVVYNVSLPEGRRVVSAHVSGTSLQDERDYWGTAPAFLAGGGDGYTMFKHKQGAKAIARDQDVLEEYIKTHSPLNIQPDGRITINS